MKDKLSRLNKRTINLSRFFDNEEMKKIYLSKHQMKSILKKIEKNNNWKNEKIDKRLEERIKFYTREDIYNKILNIENAYWIFTNRSNGVDDR